MLSFLILCTVSAVSAELTIDTENYGSVGEAINAIPMDAGKVTLKLSKQEFRDSDRILNIPSDRNIKEIILLPKDDSKTLSLPELERICANGVPLTIGPGLNLENAGIFGGSCVSGTEAVLKTSDVTVEGSVGFLFGGGFAENAGSSAVEETSVTLKNTGLVYYEIFGGGHAYGEGSQVKSQRTSLSISGSADYVLGGGFAEDGGTSVCEQTDIIATENSSIPVALFTGGSASGEGSLSTVENAKAVLSGKANWAFSGDFAFGGGQTCMERATRLEILDGAISEIAYMGSFASDEGSEAFVNTSELMVCGTVSQIIRNGQSTDHGETRTMIPALFSCK